MHKVNKLKYFELVRELAITGFKLKYRGSFFGYLWSLMKPLFLFLVLYLVFNNVFKLGSEIPNYPIYLLIGVTLWGFFAETTSMCMGSIVGSGDLIRKVYFPRIILPIATSITSFITLLLNLVVIFMFMLANHLLPTANLVYLPLLLIEFYIFTLGVSFFLASFYVKFRDIGPIWEVVAQTLFYATPILYAPNLIPSKYLNILMLNPIAQIIQDVRMTLLGADVFTSSKILGPYIIIVFVIVVVIFFLGSVLLQSMSGKFAEEV